MTSLLWKHTFGSKKKSDVSEKIYIYLKERAELNDLRKKCWLFDFLDLVLCHFSSIFLPSTFSGTHVRMVRTMRTGSYAPTWAIVIL